MPSDWVRLCLTISYWYCYVDNLTTIKFDFAFNLLTMQFSFDTVFPEERSTKLFAACFDYLKHGFQATKLCHYNLLVCCFGFPIVLFWSIFYGIVLFIYVWCFLPLLKVFAVIIYSICNVCSIPCIASCTPVVDIFARCARQIEIKAVKKDKCIIYTAWNFIIIAPQVIMIFGIIMNDIQHLFTMKYFNCN